MINEKVELDGCVTIEKDVEKRIRTVGVRGLDIDKARDLGLFQRISFMLCASHASVMAAYRIYGDVDYLLSQFGGRKNEIAKAMKDYEKAFAKFVLFWTDYYTHDGDAWKDVGNETESLYHNIMRWAQLPESWQLGDEQRIEDKSDVAIKILNEDGVLTFHKCVANAKNIEEPRQSWCVTRYDKNEGTQTVVNSNMDKASAMMVAKRMSDNDKESIYTANMVFDIKESRTEITPYKSYKANKTIGTIKKEIR